MPSYNSDIGISIPTEANRSAPLTAAYYLGEPLRAGSPMQLGVTLVGSDQQDFLNRLDLPIRREFDPTVVAFGARRQYFDDQERIAYRLPPDFDRGATRSDIGFEVSIGSVRPYHAGFDLCITRTPRR